MANHIVFVLSLLAFACALAFASGPSPVQDFYIADPASSARVNGFPCLDPKLAQADHFFLSGLDKAGNTSNPLAPLGLIPLHFHPRATEVLTVLEGSLYVGFVTSNPNNQFISKVLQKGGAFVFIVGLIHFQQNVGQGKAISISALSSQNPGIITVANAVFGSKPSIADDILSKAFQVDKSVIDHLQVKF
ncbi:hypothetical protein ACB092_05G196500 [Castanea dentata]